MTHDKRVDSPARLILSNVARFALWIGLAASLPLPVFGDGFASVAKELARAAKRANIEHVAVLPFAAGPGGNIEDGWSISEKLVTQLVRTGEVQIVERSLLDKLLGEHRLAKIGLLDPLKLSKMGKFLPVEGIVTGSFVLRNGKIILNTRLISVETARIIAASEQSVAREWPELKSKESALDQDALRPWMVHDLAAARQDSPLELKDSPANDPCVDLEIRIDLMEEQILEIKAQYWARHLKSGKSMSGQKVFPGSTISNLELKQTLYDRIKDWYARPNIPTLQPEETRRLNSTEQRIFTLYHQCRI